MYILYAKIFVTSAENRKLMVRKTVLENNRKLKNEKIFKTVELYLSTPTFTFFNTIVKKYT